MLRITEIQKYITRATGSQHYKEKKIHPFKIES